MAEALDRFEAYRDRVERPLWRLFNQYGRERFGIFVLGLLLSIVERGLTLVPPYLLGVAIDAVIADEEPYTLPFVPQAWIPGDTVGQFWLSVGLIGGAFVLSAVLLAARQLSLDYFSHRLMHDVRTATYERLQDLDMAVFDAEETGELMSVLNNDVSNFETFFDDALGQAVRITAILLGVVVILFSLNAQLAVVTLFVVPFLSAFTLWFMRRVEPAYDAIRSAVGSLNTRLENNLGGMHLIKSAATESHENERVDDASWEYFATNWHRIKLEMLYYPGMRLLSNGSFLVTFLVGGYWVSTGTAPLFFTGDLTVGAFVTFLFMSQRFTGPLRRISTVINHYENARASGKRVFALLDMPVRVSDDPDAVELDGIEGRVEYDDVTFSYERPGEGPSGPDAATDGGIGAAAGDDAAGPASDDQGPVLTDISFTADPGETVALVGPTGAGKSTVMKLLLRFYDADDGAVRVDGHDVRDVTLRSLRRHVGYVGQEAFLFGGTIRENIAYGTFDATDEEVREAAKVAEAHEFITDLPEGYDSQVGERGVKLSGGQRQRISIARTVLGDPDVLVLDEATSDVDTETEVLIKRGLDRISADRTTFTIAHRLSTVRDADTILVLDGGEIVERGSHEELLDEDGLYANLWSVQVGNVEDLPDDFLERVAGSDGET